MYPFFIITLCAMFTGVIMGLTPPLLAIEIERMGSSSFINGLNTAVGAVAVIMIMPWMSTLIQRYGPKKLLIISFSISAATILLFYFFRNLGFWFIFRMILSGSSGVSFAVSEFEITRAAPTKTRGRAVAIFNASLSSGFACGAIMLSLVGRQGWQPYGVGATLFLIAAAIIFSAYTNVSLPPPEEKKSIFTTIRRHPRLMTISLLVGFLEGSFLNLLAVYEIRSGLSEDFATKAVIAALVGGVILQFPIGWFSDNMGRKKALSLCVTLSIITALGLLLTDPASSLSLALLFIIGGLTGGLYTIGLSFLGDNFSIHELIVANAAFVMLYAAGNTLGMPLLGFALDVMGPIGFPLIIFCLLLCYGVSLAIQKKSSFLMS